MGILNNHLHVKISDEQYKFIKDRAYKDNRSIGQLVRYIIDKYKKFVSVPVIKEPIQEESPEKKPQFIDIKKEDIADGVNVDTCKHGKITNLCRACVWRTDEPRVYFNPQPKKGKK